MKIKVRSSNSRRQLLQLLPGADRDKGRGIITEVSEDDLRTFDALATMLDEHDPALPHWLVSRRPAWNTALFTTIFGPPSAQAPRIEAPEGDEPEAENEIGLGISDGRPVRATLESLRKHAVIFAGSGSGKTVIAATNRQTAVSEEELSVREDFHKELEEWFAAQEPARRLWYERRSKQYANQPEVEKTRVINRAELTRAYAAMFLGEPASVGRYKDLTTRRHGDLFQPGHLSAAYYVAAATHYRLEWLFRNRRVRSFYRPTRYHLMAALKLRAIGPNRLASSPKEAAKQCEKLAALVWDTGATEREIYKLLPALNGIIEEEEAAGIPLGEMVRNKRFGDAVRASVLA